MIASVSTWSAHDLLMSGALDSDSLLDLIQSKGAKGVEPVNIDFQDSSLPAMAAFQEAAAKRGLIVTCMSLDHNLCLPTAEARENDIQKAFDWFRAARAMGVKHVRVFTGWMVRHIPYPMQMEWVHSGMYRLLEEAERLGVALALENHDNVCLAASEILGLIKAMKPYRLYTCPDVFNYKMYDCDENPIVDDWSFAEIEKLMPYAKNAHLKICETVDGVKDRFLDIPRFMELLRRYDYDGPVALEFMWPYITKRGGDCLAELSNAIEVVCRYVR